MFEQPPRFPIHKCKTLIYLEVHNVISGVFFAWLETSLGSLPRCRTPLITSSGARGAARFA